VLARDLAVIFLGLVAGYWTVSKLQDWLAKRARDSGPAIGPSDTAAAPPPSPGDSPWFVVLGVPENAPVDAIVAAYKRKISEYHPDKVARMGAEIRELAELRSKQINAAYEAAMRWRGA
jgi:DnaJ like chaperone protein